MLWSRCVLLAALLAACRDDEPPPDDVAEAPGSGGLSPLEPLIGTWFGANLDLDNDTMSGFGERLGRDAATYVQFVPFPMDDGDERILTRFLIDVAQHGGLAVVTLEPRVRLEKIGVEHAEDLAAYLADFNEKFELGILVRFAHEMNGSWYSWSQQPIEYRRVWRVVADAVHQQAPRTGMLWAPSYPGGYPFSGGRYEAHPGDPGFELLDTDGDGVLTMDDDPYLPYWPGDAYVDWAGLSLYHWGAGHPWGENEVPEPGKFVDHVTGQYLGTAGDERGVPDFYAEFADRRGKPMALVETAALYNPGAGGADELEIKRAWWRQVFADEVFERFPRLRMINWFEWDKHETEIGGERIDWTVTVDPEIRAAYLADFPEERFLFAPVGLYTPDE